VTMKETDDRRVLKNQLASIQSTYNDASRKIDREDLVVVVWEKAPNCYKSILAAEQRIKGSKLTLTDLNSCMHDLTLPTKLGHRRDKATSSFVVSVVDCIARKRSCIQTVQVC
jgi:hypothetical protein